MGTFLKSFFATLLGLLVFSIAIIIALSIIFSSATKTSKTNVGSKAVLVLDLSDGYPEQAKMNTLSGIFGNEQVQTPGLFDVVRMINYAKSDSSVKGIYIKAESNANGFAASDELRSALENFKSSGKFIIAYGNVISQRAYGLASVANEIYCNPVGGLEWSGYSVDYLFMKGLLDRLKIEPEIFYAGKFKSATEPLRATQMTDANRWQTSVWLNDLYKQLLLQTSSSRNIDTGTLHGFANTGVIQTANDAVKYKLLNGVAYDDQVRNEIAKKLKVNNVDDINFISLAKYYKASDFKQQDGDGKIAVIYANGDIVDGKGSNDNIGGATFVKLLRKARLNNDIKAIVFRVNSPGGSALASETIWREIELAKKAKPFVVSMGDYAASGGYYISCAADSIFTNPGTITGSIGVFTVMANMQQFFNSKLGITFDGIKTAPYADMGSIARPLSPQERNFAQASIDTIYNIFKQRVADGRNRDTAYIDSIAQGRVWTGVKAVRNGLADRIGTMQDAVNCAARMARLKTFWVKEYPEPKPFLQQLADNDSPGEIKEKVMAKTTDYEQLYLLQQAKKIKDLLGRSQARLPFDIVIH